MPLRPPDFFDQPTLGGLNADVRDLYARLTALEQREPTLRETIDLVADVVQRLETQNHDLNEHASAIQGLEQTVGDVVSKAPAEWERLATRIEEVARQTALNAEVLRAIMQKLGMER